MWFRRGRRTGPTTITWSEEGFQVSPSTELYTQMPQVAVGPDGEVYVAYLRMTSSSIPDADAIQLSRSLSGGAPGTWTTGIPVSSVDAVEWFVDNTWRGARHASAPSLCVSQTTGTILVAWTDDRNGDDDILLSRSEDGGDSWLPSPIRVNDDTLGNGNDQLHPAAVVSSAGVLDVVFYDRRDDPANTLFNIYLARSWDEGDSWDNYIITDEPTDPAVFRGNQGGLGDYIGIASTTTSMYQDRTLMAWADGRVGTSWPSDLNTDIFFDSQNISKLLFEPYFVIYTGASPIRSYVPLWLHPIEVPIQIIPIYDFQDQVELSVTGLPTGAQYYFDNSSGIPPFETNLHILLNPEVSEGRYEFNIRGSSDKRTINKLVEMELTNVPYIVLETVYANPEQTIGLIGRGFTPDSSYSVFFDGEKIQSGIVTSVGSLSTDIQVPGNAKEGEYEVTVVDDEGVQASAFLLTLQIEEEEEEPTDLIPAILVDPLTLDFGNKPVDYPPLLNETIITNVGLDPLTVEAITLTEDDEGAFTINGIYREGPLNALFPAAPPFVLNPGKSGYVRVEFDDVDEDARAYGGTLEIVSNDPNNTIVEVSLLGGGTTASGCGTLVMTTVPAVDEHGTFGLTIDVGGNITALAVFTEFNVLDSHFSLTDDNRGVDVEGQLEKPDLSGQIILEITSENSSESLGVYGIIIAPYAYAPSDWPMFRMNREHGGTTCENVTTPLTLKWTYMASDEVYSSPAISQGVLFIGSEDDRIYAVDATSGTLRWNYTTGGDIWSSPLVVAAYRMVYVGSEDNSIYALDVVDGALRWSYPTSDRIFSSPTLGGKSYDTVYVGSRDGKIYALDAFTGVLKWNYTTGGGVDSAPAISDGVVYVGSFDGNVYALNSTDGTLIRLYETGAAVYSSPAVSGDGLYVGSDDGNVYAFDASSNAVRWNYSTGNLVRSSPAVSGGTVYVGSYDGNIYALNATNGALIWNYTTGHNVYSSPAVSGDTVYCGSRDGFLYALDASTGLLKWSYATGDIVHSSPAVSGGVVFVGSKDSHIYAFAADHDNVHPDIFSWSLPPDEVQPADEVYIVCHVSDLASGVKRVSLHVTGNGALIIINMTKVPFPNRWDGIIPPFPYCTTVEYHIVAEDYAGNIATSEELGYPTQYHVIPEFPASSILLLFMIATLLVVITYKTKHFI
jgi:outer membrane protein assembly factor BamB